MALEAASGRLVKGTGVVDIVKLVRHARSTRSLSKLRPVTEALLETRILPTEWYPHEAFLELIELAYVELLGKSEPKTIGMGAAGGTAQLQGPHRAFVVQGDVAATAWSMRHMWRLNFNFGELRAERDDHGITYSVTGYGDVPASHGFMIVGWVGAGTQLASTRKPVMKIMERPWLGDAALTWRVVLEPERQS